MTSSGVYKIQSISHPNRVYVGSSINLKNRWKQHLKNLKRYSHSSVKLQRHYNKYGENDLEFSVLAVCNKEELRPLDKIIWIEQCFIWAYKDIEDIKPYFNSSPTAGSTFGIKHSPEFGEHISKIRKGKVPWNKGLRGMQVAWNKGLLGYRVGTKMSEEGRDKIRKSKIGIKNPRYGKEPWNKGKKDVYSNDVLNRMSKIKEGKTQSYLTIEKRRISCSKTIEIRKQKAQN